MISILVPVYNTTVYKLIEALSYQLTKNKLQGEIIVFDDFSDDFYREQNRSLYTLPFVCYKELESNQGRIVIRKLLAANAQNEWLIFIDGDSCIINNNFLQNYYSSITLGLDIIQGGREYPSLPSTECNKRLHWLYGSKREKIIRKFECRFHSNNFCIRKTVFEKLTFPIELSGYGHEDTWIGMQLDIINAKKSFIDNPVLHEGLEPTESFLAKTENALYNLLKLSQITDWHLLKKHVRLFEMYTKIKSFKLEGPILFQFKFTKKIILKNLHSINPSLFLFDWYRLCKLIEIEKQQKKSNNAYH